jgi:hypothetical protein
MNFQLSVHFNKVTWPRGWTNNKQQTTNNSAVSTVAMVTERMGLGISPLERKGKGTEEHKGMQ